ncbi:MAG: YndJ family transporter [Acidimicrobiales bacterium]
MIRRGTAKRQAAVGAATWLGWMTVVRPSWTACLLMLSPLVLVPLGLGLTDRHEAGPTTDALPRLRLAGHPAAALAGLSFTLDPGPATALLTLPWLTVGTAVATVGVARLLSRRRLDPTIGVDAGLIFLAVGAGWLTISRAGLNPLGFGDAIVQLTAIHFHYAGFALPLVAGLVARRTQRSSLVPIWVILGVPLTAAGITVGGALEWVAATVMAAGGLATAWLLGRTALAETGAARWPLGVAAASLTAGMALALGWAWSMRFGWGYLGLAGMARWHGTLNAIGFGFAALVGLHLAAPAPARREHLSIRLGRPKPSVLAAIGAQAASDEPTNPVGLLHRPTPPGFRRDEWGGPVHHGFEAARHGLERWAGHAAAGIAIDAPPPIAVGETVAMSIPVGPLSLTATARIVEVIDEADRFGFTYATLPHHPEDGEESFIITRDVDGTCHYTVTAVWRPGTLAARIVPPLTRFLQQRAADRYLDGVAGHRPAPADSLAA